MSEETHQTHHHIVPLKVYFAVFGTLMVLTLVTVAVSKVNMDLGAVPLNLAVAITIAKRGADCLRRV